MPLFSTIVESDYFILGFVLDQYPFSSPRSVKICHSKITDILDFVGIHIILESV